MRAALLLVGLSLTACTSEPSFNETYDARAEELGNKAKGIEAELDEQLNASIRAGGLPDNPNPADLSLNEAAER